MNPQQREWTVLVYLACDNDLSVDAVWNLTEMKKAAVGPGNNVTVIAQFDSSGQGDLRGHGIPTKRYVVNRSSSAAEYQDGMLKDDQVDDNSLDPETNTGDPKTLLEFIKWGITNYRAEKYMLVLNGHSSGTQSGFLLSDDHVPLNNEEDSQKRPQRNGNNEPTEERNFLSLKDLRWVLNETCKLVPRKKLDILLFDTCLMSLAEIVCQARDTTEVLISSQGYSPNAGWPYRQMLEVLTGNPTSDVRPVASDMVERYIRFYSDYYWGGLDIDQSALDVTKWSDLHRLITDLASKLIEEFGLPGDHLTEKGEKFKRALVYAHWQAQSYNGEQFVDLYDFCDCLKQEYGRIVTESPVLEKCEAVKAFLTGQSGMVIRSCYSGPTYQFSHGVSIYFPWAGIDPDYSNLDFNEPGAGRFGKWLEFLIYYTILTRREERGARQQRFTVPAVGTPEFQFRAPPDIRGPNNIVSMRNPPLDFEPSDCLKKPSGRSGIDKSPQGRKPVR